MIIALEITSGQMDISPYNASQIYCNQCFLSVCETWHKNTKALQFQTLCQGRVNYLAPPPLRNQVILNPWWKCKTNPELHLSRPEYLPRIRKEMAIKTRAITQLSSASEGQAVDVLPSFC